MQMKMNSYSKPTHVKEMGSRIGCNMLKHKTEHFHCFPSSKSVVEQVVISAEPECNGRIFDSSTKHMKTDAV